jgi:signal transduction histidine kinase
VSHQQSPDTDGPEDGWRPATAIAHDLNNLFAGILGYTELLLGEFDEADPRRRDIEAIRHSIGRAVALADRLETLGARHLAEEGGRTSTRKQQ